MEEMLMLPSVVANRLRLLLRKWEKARAAKVFPLFSAGF
jgi:hypothetical protein